MNPSLRTHPARCKGWWSLLWALCLFGCAPEHTNTRGWVRMGTDGFVVDDRPFFMMAVNYVATPFWIGGACHFGPTESYASVDREMPRDPHRRRDELRAHWALCRELGFNTVRVVGISDLMYDSTSTWILCRSAVGIDTLVHLGKENMEAYLDGMQEMFDAARAEGIRLVPLMQVRPDKPFTEDLFAQVADRFVNDTIVLAYDLFNEPLYFDGPERPKNEAREILLRWRKLFDAHAPNQLYTIGLTGIRETFEFDPNMLEVDFVSFHPYEYEPDQVRNELRWYQEHVDVPWVIGETAIPSDGDSVPYADQASFAAKTLLQTRACGAWGYSWWQFQDVGWGSFHQDHMGVLDRTGTTTMGDGRVVAGTPKPMAAMIQGFDPAADPGKCLLLPNYTNYSDGRVCRLVGRLVDDRGQPVEGGTVIAWNEGWGSSYHTVSGPDGRFDLRAPEWVFHWMVSATRHGMRRGECDPKGTRYADGMPTFQLGRIEIERLPFLQ